jgi:hypothetical protein
MVAIMTLILMLAEVQGPVSAILNEPPSQQPQPGHIGVTAAEPIIHVYVAQITDPRNTVLACCSNRSNPDRRWR